MRLYKHKLNEEKLKRYNVNLIIEGHDVHLYTTDDLDKAKEVIYKLDDANIKGKTYLWDTQEDGEIIVESLNEDIIFDYSQADVDELNSLIQNEKNEEKKKYLKQCLSKAEYELKAKEFSDKIDETYDKEELKKMIGKVFNQQKIENIYRRKKYDDSRLFASTKCTKCGRHKKVFLSNLINDPKKYGSCVCSDENIDSKIDYASKLYSNQKKLRNNTSGYTGVSFVKNYGGKPYNKWRAYIEVDGTRTYLGDFDNKTDAVKARKAAGEKGIKWYQENRNKLIKNVRKRTKKFATSKYRDTISKTKQQNVKKED